jgi:hypothetical protein
LATEDPIRMADVRKNAEILQMVDHLEEYAQEI